MYIYIKFLVGLAPLAIYNTDFGGVWVGEEGNRTGPQPLGIKHLGLHSTKQVASSHTIIKVTWFISDRSNTKTKLYSIVKI